MKTRLGSKTKTVLLATHSPMYVLIEQDEIKVYTNISVE